MVRTLPFYSQGQKCSPTVINSHPHNILTEASFITANKQQDLQEKLQVISSVEQLSTGLSEQGLFASDLSGQRDAEDSHQPPSH